MIWFNVWMPKGGLAKVDPKTEKVAIYMPPDNMSHIDGPVTLDYDSKGGIWAGTDGALRFDPVTEKFTEFKSVIPKGPNKAQGSTYGIAATRTATALDSRWSSTPSGSATARAGTRCAEIKLRAREGCSQ